MYCFNCGEKSDKICNNCGTKNIDILDESKQIFYCPNCGEKLDNFNHKMKFCIKCRFDVKAYKSDLLEKKEAEDEKNNMARKKMLIMNNLDDVLKKDISFKKPVISKYDKVNEVKATNIKDSSRVQKLREEDNLKEDKPVLEKDDIHDNYNELDDIRSDENVYEKIPEEQDSPVKKTKRSEQLNPEIKNIRKKPPQRRKKPLKDEASPNRDKYSESKALTDSYKDPEINSQQRRRSHSSVSKNRNSSEKNIEKTNSSTKDKKKREKVKLKKPKKEVPNKQVAKVQEDEYYDNYYETVRPKDYKREIKVGLDRNRILLVILLVLIISCILIYLVNILV